MENVVMRDTSGTPPMAGIDFEPNDPTEVLSNIVMRNYTVQNNSGDGFAFYLHNLNSTSRPISIRLEGCRSIGNRRSVSVSVGNSKEKTVSGVIEFVDCKFEGSEVLAYTSPKSHLSAARFGSSGAKSAMLH